MSDPIERQAAMNVVKRLMGDSELSRTVQTGLHILPSAHSPNWIPLSEKFPQEDEDVLLQFPSNQGVGYYEDGDWMINTGDGIYSIIGYNEEKPIAWMPLPQPYEGEDNEQTRTKG